MVAHTCGPNIWEVEAGRSGVQRQPQLNEILSQKTNKKVKK